MTLPKLTKTKNQIAFFLKTNLIVNCVWFVFIFVYPSVALSAWQGNGTFSNVTNQYETNIKDGVNLENRVFNTSITDAGSNESQIVITDVYSNSVNTDLTWFGNTAEMKIKNQNMGDWILTDLLVRSDSNNMVYTFTGEEIDDPLDINFSVAACQKINHSITVDDFVGEWDVNTVRNPNLRSTSEGFDWVDNQTVTIQKNGSSSLQVTYREITYPFTVTGNSATITTPDYRTSESLVHAFKIVCDGEGIAAYFVDSELYDSNDIGITLAIGSRIQTIQEWYQDADGDGYGDPNASIQSSTQPSGYVSDNTDCNDSNSSIHPGATEISGDGIDQDCNGSDLESLASTYQSSIGNDVFISDGGTVYSSGIDNQALDVGYRHFVNGDNEFRSVIQFDIPSWLSEKTITGASLKLYYLNAWGSSDYRSIRVHTLSDSWSENNLTWFPNYQSSYSEATVGGSNNRWISWNVLSQVNEWLETGIQNNGVAIIASESGSNDNAFRFASFEHIDSSYHPILEIHYTDPPEITWYYDQDNDGYGNPANSTESASQPTGYVTDNTDCNDSDAAVNPGAAETCNGTDDNCNSVVDEGCSETFSYYMPVFKPAPGYWSGLGVSNLNASNRANVTVTVYNQAGTISATEYKTISASGQENFLVGSSATSDGWIKVSSDQALAGLNFLGEYDSGTTDYYLGDVPFTSSLSTSMLIPHVAQNTTWDTTVYLANPGASTASVTLTYTDKYGVSSTPYLISVSGSGSAEVTVSTITGSTSIRGGYVTINSNQGVTAFALYNNLKTNNYSYAGISAIDISTVSTALNYYLPVFKSKPDYWSGLGITNLSSTNTANVMVTVYDQLGSITATEAKILSVKGQDNFLVGSSATSDGWIKISSDRALAGLNFLGEYKRGTTDYYLGDVPFTSSLSTSLLIPHVAQNTTWDTTVYLANPNNSVASVSLIYKDKDGAESTPYTVTIPANGSKEIAVSTIGSSSSIRGGCVSISSTQGLTAFALYNNLKTNNCSYAGINAVDNSDFNDSHTNTDCHNADGTWLVTVTQTSESSECHNTDTEDTNQVWNIVTSGNSVNMTADIDDPPFNGTKNCNSINFDTMDDPGNNGGVSTTLSNFILNSDNAFTCTMTEVITGPGYTCSRSFSVIGRK